MFFPDRNNADLAQQPPGNYDWLYIDESGVNGRVRAAACLCFVWRRSLGGHHSHPLLGGAGKALKRHAARSSDADAAIIEVLNYPPCFR